MLRPTRVSLQWSRIPFAYGTFTLCGPLSQHGSARYAFCNSTYPLRQVSKRSLNPATRNDRSLTRVRFGLFPFRSPLLRESHTISLPPATEMFHFAGFPPPKRVTGLLPAGFPHSGISGSKVACASPKLFAACHALHRPLVPRHPPCALCTLTSLISFIHLSVVKVLSQQGILLPCCENLYTGRNEKLADHAFLRAWLLLLRKEVIQPHLPVRLPCYDFTPLTRHTFDGSIPYGFSHRLRVPPTRVV